MLKKVKKITLLTLLLISQLAIAQETENGYSWPLEMETKDGSVITLYQPQLESFDANILEGRMAITIKPKEKDMVFGAVWFKANVSTDTENRTVLLEKMHIEKTHFPEMIDEEKKAKFSKALETEMESWNLEM